MKYIYIAIFVLSAFLFYNLPTVTHILYLMSAPHADDDFVFYKDIKNIDKNISGEYDFNCKYPNIFDIGLGAKKKILKSPFINKDSAYRPNVKLQIDVYSGNKIIFSKIVFPIHESTVTFSDEFYYKDIILATFPICRCSNNLKFKITKISGSFNTKDVSTDDLFYLYISISRTP